jgi:anti-sigma factor RsiW
MTCTFQMETGAYALGILAPGDHERMTLHLEGCASCRSDVAEFTAMLEPLQSIAVRPPTGQADR